jgi:SAM-dependent methyltransferase
MPPTFDVVRHNRAAWDREVDSGNPWTVPVTPEQITAARAGEWSVVLTPSMPVPRDWFGALAGSRVLCLASGGGQQAPILAAAGARVTVLDNSPRQLARDEEVAKRERLDLGLELGEMADLSRFADAGFDLVFHPVSNLFVPDVRPVWREVARVLVPGGALLAGFCNSVLFMFDADADERGEVALKHRLPYADLTSLPRAELDRRIARGEPLEFGHSLEDQIGGQIDAGLVITGFFEDGFPGRAVDAWTPTLIATRATKPRAI